MADNGSGGSGGAGSGYQVEVGSLRTFAGQVRGLLAEFQQHADGPTTHARSGIGSESLGTFAEATALRNQYDLMRDGLRDVLTALQEAIDDSQKKADLTADNYDRQEQDTVQSLRVSDDGWSVGTLPGSPLTYGAGAAGVVTGAVTGRKAAAAGGGGAPDAAPEATVDQDAGVPEGVPQAGAPVAPGSAGKRNSGGKGGAAGQGGSAGQGGEPAPESDGTGNGPVQQPTW
ncbi:hypothetical protein [Kitasatospora sp. LaBMicrA B282]|uniref:hypothetical protein n=1 Tax=Kitasatospora sp. LaBMicrA B282 TaxID=3420949 RepID=UPI003D0C9D2B